MPLLSGPFASVRRALLMVGLTLLLGLKPDVAAAPPPSIDPPVSPNASPEVVQLLAFLRNVQGKFVLSGQQEFPGWPDTIAIGQSSDPDFKRILDTTGKMPVVRGFDFLFYTHSASSRAVQRSTERAIEWWRRGGIVTFCAHLFMDAGSPAGSPQFYVPSANNGVGTTIDINQVLIAGTPENAEFNTKLDLMAEELKKLSDARVPVLWRPFHECSGGWFWWGAKGAAPLIAAYRYMFERYTVKHGLNNLIWVYNPTETGTNLETWYPGDAYVDMISYDFYSPTGTHPTRVADYNRALTFKGGRKLVAMSENGAMPDPDQLVADKAWWSYFCTWNGSFIRDGVINPVSLLQRIYHHPRVLTLDEIGAFFPRPDQTPEIVIQPSDVATGEGGALSLGVVASGGSSLLSYQWKKNGGEIAGAHSASLRFASLNASDAGSYTVTVKNANGSITSSAANVAVNGMASSPTSALVNLSTRGAIIGAGDVMVAGFTVSGSGSKRVLIRAVGPTLGDARFNLTDAMADPGLTLTRVDGSLVARSDDWDYGRDRGALRAAFAAAGAFDLSDESRDAAMVVDLPPGGYTALVSGVDGGSGIAIVEIYDLEPGSAARLVNLSTRASVGTGNNALVVGFTTAGPGNLQLLTRGIGPALSHYGVANVLENPRVELTRLDGTVLQSNTGWEQFNGSGGPAAIATVAGRTGAFPLPMGSKDAALLHTQSAGGRTVIIRGVGDTTGTALVEVYADPVAAP